MIIYGAGKLGKMAKAYFDMLNIRVSCVVDQRPELYINDSFWKENVLLPENIPAGSKCLSYYSEKNEDEQRKTSLLVICVVTAPLSEITAPLKNQGWADIIPFYEITEKFKNIIPIGNGWSCDLNQKDKTGIESIMSQWEDDISRAHYLQFIAWRCLREEWIFKNAPITTNNRYFTPEITSVLHDHEVFVDVGAHHGEVVLRFINEVKNRFNQIYAFEPDIENFKNLYNNLKENIDEKICLSTKALGIKEEEKSFFSGLGYASQFSDLGKSKAKVEVRRLDDLNISPSFIKIHVEGHESDVIRGGIETIIRNRPVLVVTSYHNQDGLWHLPAQIMALRDYVFYFRLHAWQGQGSVIYAIPRERERQISK